VIVVDSSVWSGDLRNDGTSAVVKLRALDPMVPDIVVPDLVLLEVLRGVRNETYATQLVQVDIVGLGGRALAVTAALHYRYLCGLGVTICSSIDVLIGSFCIQHDASLLHHDRGDFVPMERHLGLRCL
jgi:predicted nucleic acid-binding protein